MADYSVALGVQSPTIDIARPFAMAAQLRREQLAEEQARHSMGIEDQRLAMERQQAAQRNSLIQLQLSQQRGEQNALTEYSKDPSAPGAVDKLSRYPEVQSHVLAVRGQMAEGERQQFDQKMMRNARRAQYVMGLQGDAKTQGWQESLKDAADHGDIPPQQFQQLSQQPPNDLLLHNIISQAVPIQELYKAQEPTAEVRNLKAAGIEPTSPEGRTALTGGKLLPKFKPMPDGTIMRQDPVHGGITYIRPPSMSESAQDIVDKYKTVEDYTKSLPSSVANAANSIASYDRAPISGRASVSGYGAQVMDAVENIARLRGQTYDATQFGTKQQARKEFTTAITARTLDTGKTGIGHLYDLVESVGEIDPGQYPIINKASNLASTELGHGAVKAYNANAGYLASELTSFYRNTGGAEADIHRAITDFNAANSLEQQKAVIGKVAGMVADKLEAVTHRRDFAFGARGAEEYPILNDRARKQLAAIQQWAADPKAKDIPDWKSMPDIGGTANRTQPPENRLGGGAQSTTGGASVHVNSADEARQLIQSGKLKSGDHFTDENGTDRVVH